MPKNQNLIRSIAIFLLVYSTSLYPQEWEWVNPGHQGNALCSVNYFSKSTLVSAGLHGTIMQSINGGAGWSLKNSKTSYGLTSQQFVNDTSGFVVGRDGAAIITEDGSESQTKEVIRYGHKSQAICKLIGVITPNGDSTMIVNFDPETGIPTIHRQINHGFAMEESPGVFNPETRNFVEYGETEDDYSGLLKFNYDEGGISKMGDPNWCFFALTYDYTDHKIYGLANYWFEDDSDSTYVVEVDDVSGTITKLFNIHDTLEIESSIYTYNHNTNNFISYAYNESECYLQTINVKTGVKHINHMPEDIMALFYDADSNSVYGLELISDSLFYFKVNEISGEKTYIKNLGESIIDYPWPFDLGAYNQENKTLYYPTINNEEDDQTLFMINLETGVMTENNGLEAKYGGYLGLIQYVCPIESEECVDDIQIEMNVSQCGPFISPSGKYTWDYSGNYHDTITIQGNCDTIYNINLTINDKTNSSIEVSACGSYVSPSGKTWTASGTYLDTIPNSAGCDSVIEVNLLLDLNTRVFSTEYFLVAVQKDATYQWLDCDNGFSPLMGETNHWYSVQKNGNYAVEITREQCKDTSQCVSFSATDVIQNEFANEIRIFPNPAQDYLNISSNLEDAWFTSITLVNQLGQLVIQKVEKNKNNKNIRLSLESLKPGIYYMMISGENKSSSHKVIISR